MHPTYVVEVSTIVCPATALLDHVRRRPPDSARRSGDWWASIGVGTQTTIASASRERGGFGGQPQRVGAQVTGQSLVVSAQQVHPRRT